MLTFKTPLCELQYVSINGKGKKKYDPTNSLDDDDAKNFQYVATAILTEKQATAIKKILTDFWRANKPAGSTKQKYDLLKPYTTKTEELDEDGDAIKEAVLDDDGKPLYTMMFKTGTVWPDGKAQAIKVLRANGAPLRLGDKVIGNGSIGVIHGKIGVNGFGGNEGLLAFLSAVQLKKYVEPTDEVDADDLGDDEGLDDLDMPDVEDVSSQDGPNI